MMMAAGGGGRDTFGGGVAIIRMTFERVEYSLDHETGQLRLRFGPPSPFRTTSHRHRQHH